MKELIKFKDVKKTYNIGDKTFNAFGAKFDDFFYRTFSNSGDCNISYLEKAEKDLKRNGFNVIHRKKLTTFIYTVVGQK